MVLKACASPPPTAYGALLMLCGNLRVKEPTQSRMGDFATFFPCIFIFENAHALVYRFGLFSLIRRHGRRGRCGITASESRQMFESLRSRITL